MRLTPDLLRRGFAWNHAAKLSEYALVYLFALLAARALGPASNGTYATLVAVSQLLVALSSAGIDLAFNRFLPAYASAGAREKIAYVVRRLLLVKFSLLFVLGAALAAAWTTASGWFGIETATGQFLAFVVIFGFVRAFSASLTAIWLALFNPKPVFISNTITLILQCGALLLMMRDGATLAGILWLVVAGGAASCAASFLLMRGIPTAKAEPVPLRPILSFSGWLWINAFMEYFQGKQGDIAMLGLLGVGKESVGRYDIAHALSQLPGFAVAAGLSGVSFSVFSRLSRSGASETAGFWLWLTRLMTQAAVPLYCFALVFGGDIISSVYSAAYLSALPFFTTLVAARLVVRLFGGGENTEALLSLSRERPVVFLGISSAAVNVALNLALIPVYGALGAALGTSAATIGVNAATWYLLRKHAGVPLPAWNWAVSCLIGITPVLLCKAAFPAPGPGALGLCAVVCAIVWGTGIILLRRFAPSPPLSAFLHPE